MVVVCNTWAIPTQNLELCLLGWKTRAGEARVTWVIWEGGWRGATRLRLCGRATAARWAARWQGGCEARRVGQQRCGGSAAETTRCGSHGAQGLDGAHQCKRCRAGGGARPDLTFLNRRDLTFLNRRWRAARFDFPQQLFSCFLLLPRDQVKGERGRRAGWARSASRRVAVVGAHLQSPERALPALPTLSDGF